MPHTSHAHEPTALERFAAENELTAREAELARLAHRGFSAKRISRELFITEGTVYTHIKRIYRKTGVHSREEFIDLVDEWLEVHS